VPFLAPRERLPTWNPFRLHEGQRPQGFFDSASQKRQRPGPRGPGHRVAVLIASGSAWLDLDDVLGAGALWAVGHLEPHAITLVEGAEALGFDLGVMDENIRAALTREEPEPLGLVEPLDRTFEHERGLLGLRLATSAARPRTDPPPSGRPPEQSDASG